MRLKNYLRGLGVGLVAAALILGLSHMSERSRSMTDAEIIARAEDLGMIQNTVVSENDTLKDETPPPSQSPETSTPAASPAASETVLETPKATDDETSETPPTETDDNATPFPETADGETVYKVITVARGDSSYTVSKKLFSAGLVSSAEEYDRYLCANGYDHSINSGTYDIPMGADNKNIAGILTGIKGVS